MTGPDAPPQPAAPPVPAEAGPGPAAARWEWLALAGVLGLAVALRLYNLHVPFVDTSDWRQTDTGAVAYFYYHQGIRLLHPQLWHDGPGPDYTQLELQITPAIVAILAHLFGWSDVLLRSVALVLFTASAIPLWALVRRHFGPGVALWTALVYVLLPVGIYFGRTFQPENAQLFFGMAGLWATDRWAQRPTPARYALAAATLALAVLAKLPNLMLLPAAAALAEQDALWRWRKMLHWRRVLAVAGLVVFAAGCGAVYTLVQAAVAVNGTRYVNFIVTSLSDSYIAGQKLLWTFVWRNVLGMAITPAGAVAAAIGGWALGRTRSRAGWVWVWGLSIALYAVVVLRAIRFQYYLMPVLPWVALLAGAGLQTLAAEVPRLMPRALRALPGLTAAALLASVLTGGLYQIRGYWPPYLPWYTEGLALRRELPLHTTVILAGTYNPTLLYYARRHGYRIDKLTLSVLDADIGGGARYLLDQGGIGTCMKSYLISTFPRFDIGGIWVYVLHPNAPLPAGDITGTCQQ